jgi:P27 family predicted phage terminase small subunit
MRMQPPIQNQPIPLVGDVNLTATAGAAFRAAYEAGWEPDTPADSIVLDRACALLDAIESMEQQVAQDGLIATGASGQPVAHPLLAVIRAHSAEVAELVRALGMKPDDIRTSRARAAARARWAAR